MKCPFLEEVVVRYCKAYPIKKPIPSSSSDTLSLCLDKGYTECSEYQRLAKGGKESKMKTQKVKGDPKFFPPNYWRICNIFACPACPYESICVAASLTARKVSFIEGFALIENLFYHPRHIWLETRKDGTLRLGIDDFAQKLLGNLTGIDLPQKGKMVKEGDRVWGIKCGERDVKLRSPIAGKIKRVNEKLIDGFSTLNKEPYRAWIFTLEPLSASGGLEEKLNEFLIGDDAKLWLEKEADRLRYRIESDIGVTVADGGALIHTVEKIDAKEWENLIKDFLLI